MTPTRIKKLSTLLPSLTALVALATFIYGVWEFKAAGEKEFRKGFWEQRLAMYKRACKSAAAIVKADSLEEAEKDRGEFWNLYYGEMSVVEDSRVCKAMEVFASALQEYEKDDENFNTERLNDPAYKLARACRKSLEATWEPVKLDDIKEPAAVAPAKSSALPGHENSTPSVSKSDVAE